MNDSDQEQRFRIGQILKYYRERRVMEQEALAKQIGVSRQTIINLESNNTGVGMETFLCICEALEIRPSDFFRAHEGAINPKWRGQQGS